MSTTATIQVQGLGNVVGTAYLPVYVQTPGTPSPDIATVQGITGGTPVPVSGTITVGSSVAVTGTFWQATQPVSISGSVPVTGTFWQATQPVSGTVGVSGSVAVTGTFWQATQPVSFATSSTVIGKFGIDQTTPGTTNAVALTVGGSALSSANPLFVTTVDPAVTGNITTLNSNLNSGAATANSTVVTGALNGAATVSMHITGIWTGTLTPQISLDNANWVNLSVTGLMNVNTNAYSATIASAATGVWQAGTAGYTYFRLTASSAMTGTAAVHLQLSVGANSVGIDNPLPPGTNVMGQINITDNTTVAGVVAATAALKTDMTSVGGTAVVNGGVAGTQSVGGIGVDAAALSGNSLLLGGSDGTNKQRIRAQADNSVLGTAGNVVVIGGQYNSTYRTISSGNVAQPAIDVGARTIVAGAAATGTALVGNPVLVAGSDGTNASTVRVQADNSTAANGLVVLPVRYDTVPRSITAGNVAVAAVDAGGAGILGNTNKSTYAYTLTGIAATTGTWNALTIEQSASATKTFYIKRITILTPGVFTTAQVTKLSLIRETTASSTGDGAIANTNWQKRDNADTATAIGRFGAAASITLGTTGNTDYITAFYSGTTLSTIQPVIFDLTNAGTLKGFVIPKTALAGVGIQIAGAAGGASLAIEVEFTEE
jgi:hypothetical protein